MAPHQERVIEEEKQLADKTAKLEAFIFGKTFMDVDVFEQTRLRNQLGYMRGYLRVLRERIEAFK